MSQFRVEFDGHCYVVLKDGLQMLACIDCQQAYGAKRDFERKRGVEDWQKVPPAMRSSKLKYYGI